MEKVQGFLHEDAYEMADPPEENFFAPKKGVQAMHEKLVSALGLMFLITALSLFQMDYSYSQGMGLGGGMMGPGMMGGGRNHGKNPVKPTAISIDNGKALFKSHCAVCHGPRGRGDGPAATGLNPRPADLMRSARMLRGGVVAGVITDGRGAMPSFKATLTQAQIWDLTNFVKNLVIETGSLIVKGSLRRESLVLMTI